MAIAKFYSLTAGAEKSSVESVIGYLTSALNRLALNQLSTNQTVNAQNPFDDLDYKPSFIEGKIAVRF